MTDSAKGGAKERLFLAAVRVFAAKGYRGATVRDICREAGGANLNAINYYFGGKKKLYRAILEVLFNEGDRQIRERLAASGSTSPEQQLRMVLEVSCRLFFSGSEVNRAFVRLWIMELANPTPLLAEMVERYSRPQTESLLAILAALVGPDASPHVLIDCMMSTLGPAVYQALIWSALGPFFKNIEPMEDYWPRLVEHHYHFAMAGLAAVRERLQEGKHATEEGSD